MNESIYRCDFDAAELHLNHPPQFHHHNKQVVYELASAGAAPAGTIAVSRWKQATLPATIVRKTDRPRLSSRNEFFSYESSDAERMEWHLNFAHFDLFCAYGGGLFAQDEMQVTEHPSLASVRHALLESDHEPLTVEKNRATPILISGVERRVSVATDVNPAEGQPYGLYGNNFARAGEDAVRRATTVLKPATISNILAMEAPACGSGQYSRGEIEFVFATALTGFHAAVHETRSFSANAATSIHTGYWGCGAYGGNRELMPLLQLLAACSAKVDAIVFHTGSSNDGFERARERLDQLLPEGASVETAHLFSILADAGYEWGVSDGN